MALRIKIFFSEEQVQGYYKHMKFQVLSHTHKHWKNHLVRIPCDKSGLARRKHTRKKNTTRTLPQCKEMQADIERIDFLVKQAEKYKNNLKERKTSDQMHRKSSMFESLEKDKGESSNRRNRTATQRQERPCQAAPTPSFAATSAPWSSSVCTTARCPPSEAACKLVLPRWRAGVRSAAGPQRQERPRQAATL